MIEEEFYEEPLDDEVSYDDLDYRNNEDDVVDVIDDDEDGEYEYNEVLGGYRKRTILSRLNKKNLSKEEMDDILNYDG